MSYSTPRERGITFTLHEDGVVAFGEPVLKTPFVYLTLPIFSPGSDLETAQIHSFYTRMFLTRQMGTMIFICDDSHSLLLVSLPLPLQNTLKFIQTKPSELDLNNHIRSLENLLPIPTSTAQLISFSNPSHTTRNATISSVIPVRMPPDSERELILSSPSGWTDDNCLIVHFSNGIVKLVHIIQMQVYRFDVSKIASNAIGSQIVSVSIQTVSISQQNPPILSLSLLIDAETQHPSSQIVQIPLSTFFNALHKLDTSFSPSFGDDDEDVAFIQNELECEFVREVNPPAPQSLQEAFQNRFKNKSTASRFGVRSDPYPITSIPAGFPSATEFRTYLLAKKVFPSKQRLLIYSQILNLPLSPDAFQRTSKKRLPPHLLRHVPRVYQFPPEMEHLSVRFFKLLRMLAVWSPIFEDVGGEPVQFVVPIDLREDLFDAQWKGMGTITNENYGLSEGITNSVMNRARELSREMTKEENTNMMLHWAKVFNHPLPAHQSVLTGLLPTDNPFIENHTFALTLTPRPVIFPVTFLVHTSILPFFIFPLITHIHSDFLCFEILLGLLQTVCWDWFVDFHPSHPFTSHPNSSVAHSSAVLPSHSSLPHSLHSHPPFASCAPHSFLAKGETLLQSLQPELFSHFSRHNISSKSYLWYPLFTFFSVLFPTDLTPPLSDVISGKWKAERELEEGLERTRADRPRTTPANSFMSDFSLHSVQSEQTLDDEWMLILDHIIAFPPTSHSIPFSLALALGLNMILDDWMMHTKCDEDVIVVLNKVNRPQKKNEGTSGREPSSIRLPARTLVDTAIQIVKTCPASLSSLFEHTPSFVALPHSLSSQTVSSPNKSMSFVDVGDESDNTLPQASFCPITLSGLMYTPFTRFPLNRVRREEEARASQERKFGKERAKKELELVEWVLKEEQENRERDEMNRKRMEREKKREERQAEIERRKDELRERRMKREDERNAREIRIWDRLKKDEENLQERMKERGVWLEADERVLGVEADRLETGRVWREEDERLRRDEEERMEGVNRREREWLMEEAKNEALRTASTSIEEQLRIRRSIRHLRQAEENQADDERQRQTEWIKRQELAHVVENGMDGVRREGRVNEQAEDRRLSKEEDRREWNEGRRRERERFVEEAEEREERRRVERRRRVGMKSEVEDQMERVERGIYEPYSLPSSRVAPNTIQRDPSQHPSDTHATPSVPQNERPQERAQMTISSEAQPKGTTRTPPKVRFPSHEASPLRGQDELRERREDRHPHHHQRSEALHNPQEPRRSLFVDPSPLRFPSAPHFPALRSADPAFAAEMEFAMQKSNSAQRDVEESERMRTAKMGEMEERRRMREERRNEEKESFRKMREEQLAAMQTTFEAMNSGETRQKIRKRVGMDTQTQRVLKERKRVAVDLLSEMNLNESASILR
ncbi:hypothetical protein BLNAU_13498 [Blattamonas nauphoetae]|uniref:Uncharacterized protein n=1 Tax=Blattamonas nauphoetae TaxID=2049346 RepID=A0ABQ9XJG3_9EUKA|nr:hypothetical protein BLNAU_13498 [Blattamonas nauphoetae]